MLFAAGKHTEKTNTEMEMVFHCQNWSIDWEKPLKFETKGREIANILGSIEQFIWTVKYQTNFWNRMLF